MPLFKRCPYPGCRALTQGGRCPKHVTQAAREDIARRGTSTARGYGSQWRKAAAGWLTKHAPPELGFSPCVECARGGVIVRATVVDHIRPWKSGRTEAEQRAFFWDSANWRALCASHHGSVGERVGGLTREGAARPARAGQAACQPPGTGGGHLWGVRAETSGLGPHEKCQVSEKGIPPHLNPSDPGPGHG
jgi:5-methylcytosine-specific restriction enzyme A